MKQLFEKCKKYWPNGGGNKRRPNWAPRWAPIALLLTIGILLFLCTVPISCVPASTTRLTIPAPTPNIQQQLPTVPEWTVEIKNLSFESTAQYRLFIVDPKIKGWPRPAPLAMGALKPGGTWRWVNTYWANGDYFIHWQIRHPSVRAQVVPFTLTDKTRHFKFVISPSGSKKH